VTSSLAIPVLGREEAYYCRLAGSEPAVGLVFRERGADALARDPLDY